MPASISIRQAVDDILRDRAEDVLELKRIKDEMDEEYTEAWWKASLHNMRHFRPHQQSLVLNGLRAALKRDTTRAAK